MRTRSLGRLGLTVSEIGLGCASFWGMRAFAEADAVRLVHRAIDLGVTVFDTGPSYSGGNAEPRLGRALTGRRGDDWLVVMTKVGTQRGRRGRLVKDFSPSGVRRSVDASLAALGRDRLDIVHLHGPALADLTDGLFETLAALKREGKVRLWGINAADAPALEAALAAPAFDSLMLAYNVMHPEFAPLIDRARQAEKAVFAAAPLASALFRRRTLWPTGTGNLWYLARALATRRADLRRAGAYRFLEAEPGWTGAQLALAFVLDNPGIASAVVGTTRASHLEDCIAASGRALPPSVRARLSAIHGTLTRS